MELLILMLLFKCCMVTHPYDSVHACVLLYTLTTTVTNVPDPICHAHRRIQMSTRERKAGREVVSQYCGY